MKKKKSLKSIRLKRVEIIALIIIIIGLAGLYRIKQIKQAAIIEKNQRGYAEYKRLAEQRAQYNCGERTNCRIIKGSKEVEPNDQTGANYPQGPNWILSQGKRISSNDYYRVWHPKDLVLDDMDSGPINLMKDNRVVLSIYQSYPLHYFNFDNNFLDVVWQIIDDDFESLEKGQTFERHDVNLSKLFFANGRRFYLIKYPHYLVWVTNPDDLPTMGENYDPIFSSYNDFDYYIGQTNKDTVSIILDFNKIPQNDVWAILQRLEITQR